MNTEEKPDIYFIGLGAFKAATTYLAMILKNHPETCMAIGKEVNYFNKHFGILRKNPNFNKPLSWYGKHYVHCEDKLKKGEFCPMYLVDSDAPEAIYKAYPNIKFIVCLRHPVDRAFSHYIMERYTQGKKLHNSFEEVIENNVFHMRAGLYYEQISRYLKYFDISQFYFMFTEDLSKNRDEELKKMFKFLELENIDDINIDYLAEERVNSFKRVRVLFIEKILMAITIFSRWLMKKKFMTENYIAKIYNTTFFRWLRELNFDSKKYPKMDVKSRKKALEYYKEDTEKLEKLLNKDLSHWKV